MGDRKPEQHCGHGGENRICSVRIDESLPPPPLPCVKLGYVLLFKCHKCSRKKYLITRYKRLNLTMIK